MRPKAAGSGKRTSVGVMSGSVRLGICRGNQLSFVKTHPAHAITRNSSRPGQSPAATLLTGHSHTVADGMLLLCCCCCCSPPSPPGRWDSRWRAALVGRVAGGEGRHHVVIAEASLRCHNVSQHTEARSVQAGTLQQHVGRGVRRLSANHGHRPAGQSASLHCRHSSVGLRLMRCRYCSWMKKPPGWTPQLHEVGGVGGLPPPRA